MWEIAFCAVGHFYWATRYSTVLLLLLRRSQELVLTSDKHNDYGEDLLVVGVRRNVAEAYRGQAADCEVESTDVFRPDRRTARIVAGERIWLLRLVGQVVEPTDRLPEIWSLVVADGVPDAGEPVGDEYERRQQQQQHCGTVLRVAVQLASDTHQAQQPRSLQQPNQRRRLSQCTPDR